MAGENIDIHMASQIETFMEEFSYFYSKNNEKFASVLENILTLAANGEESLKTIASQIDMDVLFRAICEGSISKRTTSDACKLLWYVLSTHNSLDVMRLFRKRIIESINVNNKEYQDICLKQLLRLAEEDHFEEFMSNREIIVLIFSYFSCKDTGTSRIPIKILNKLTDHEENTAWIFSSEVSEVCSNLMKFEVTVRFRVYEVFIEFLKKYPDQFDKCIETGIFNVLMKDLYNDNDILSQLGALDFVSQLALSGQQGMKFVEEKNILNWLQNVITSDDLLNNFLLPGAIKCFGAIASGHPFEIILKYRPSVNAIFENLKNNDPSIRCLSAETIGFLCVKSDVIKLLYNKPDLLKLSVNLMGKMAASPAETDILKGRILESFASMIAHDPGDVETSMICEKLFQQISSEPVSYLLSLAQQPFLEIRYGAFKILVNVSVFSWIEQDMALCAGFLEYLLDRRTETEKQGRELKYKIIKNLSVSNTSKENLGLSYYDKIVNYAREGPFYQESEVAVTYEREN